MSTSPEHCYALAAALALCVAFSSARSASAATFNVNSTGDTPDAAAANGVCADSSGVCTVTDISSSPFDGMAAEVIGDLACTEELSGHCVTLLLLDQRSVVLGSSDQGLTGKNLGGHHVIMGLGTAPGGDPSAEVGGYGAARQVTGTPLIAVAFWSRR